MTLTPTSPSPIVHGRPLRTFLLIGGILFTANSLFALWIWLGHDPLASKIASIRILFAIAALPTLALTAAAALTTARIQDNELRFAFCGLRTRTIPLDKITAYQLYRGRGAPRILYGTSRYAPSNLLDREALIALLRAHHIPGKNVG